MDRTIGRPLSWRGMAALGAMCVVAAVIFVQAVGGTDALTNWYEATLTDRRPLLHARSWDYNLGAIDIDKLAREAGDVVVIDHARSGGREPLPGDDVRRLKKTADGRRRIVLAYLSVGEAEDRRWYFDPAWKSEDGARPAWIIKANCAWPGAYAVRFWQEQWKALLYKSADSMLRRIVEARFDGVYLDRVDMYFVYPAIGKERPTARNDMIQLVVELAAAARALDPRLIVVPNNGEELLSDRGYRRSIDGLGKEELLFSESATGGRNDPKKIETALSNLRRLQRDRKPVFALEYLQDKSTIDATRNELRSLGIVSAFPTRSVDGNDPTAPVNLADIHGTPEFIATSCKDKAWW